MFEFNAILKKRKCQIGFTLLEVTVVLALMGSLALAIASVMQLQTAVAFNVDSQTARLSLMNTLRLDIANVNVLRGSLHQPENGAFLACVCGSTAGCTGGISQTLALYNPGEVSPQSNIRFFDSNGFACKQSPSGCLLQVTTTFSAQCMPQLPSANPIPPATCVVPAEFVSIHIAIEKNPAFTGTAFTFGSLQTSAYIMTSEIAPTGLGVCP